MPNQKTLALTALHRRFLAASVDYPDLSHIAILFDCHDLPEEEQYASLYFMDEYYTWLVEPLVGECPILKATCHTPETTSVMSNGFLSTLLPERSKNTATQSMSVFCGYGDDNSRVLSTLDDLSLSLMRLLFPETFSRADHRYDWAGHLMHVVHRAAIMWNDDYLRSRAHKLVWSNEPFPGMVDAEHAPVCMYEIAPGHTGSFLDGQPAGEIDGEPLRMNDVFEMFSKLNLSIRILELPVFESLAYFSECLLNSDKLQCVLSANDKTVEPTAQESADNLVRLRISTPGKEDKELTVSDMQWIAGTLRWNFSHYHAKHGG